MNHFLQGVARAAAEAFDLPAPILEIGSYQVPGQQELINLRSMFAGKSFLGVDIRPGPGVDLVASVEALPHGDNSVGTVVAMSTFEHVRYPWKGFAEIERVLQPGGAIVLSCPFHFHIHNHPSDYWRFTPEALNVMLENYPFRLIGWHGPRKRPANVWAVGFKKGGHLPAQREIENYRRLLGRYAHQPLSWLKTLRYQVGRLFCGLRPFDYYLHHNHWEILCRTAERPTLSEPHGAGPVAVASASDAVRRSA